MIFDSEIEMNDMISVVIPVYNVEKYLQECLDSVINQTYKNLQIILVDDGSTDSCGMICDHYSERDQRITVIHQTNAGAGAAKNTGLDLVKGEYLSLIDSDDYLELDFYERMLKSIRVFNADICQCLFDYVFQDAIIPHKYMFNNTKFLRSITNKRFLFEALYDWKYNLFANKLFKTSLLGDNRFPVGSKIDDEFFTYKLVCNAKRIINISNVLYHYRQRQSGVMRDSQKIELTKNRIKCFDERYSYISQKIPSLSKDYYGHMSEYIYSVYHTNDEYSNDTEIKYMYERYPLKKQSICDKVKNRLWLVNYHRFIFEYGDEKYFE